MAEFEGMITSDNDFGNTPVLEYPTSHVMSNPSGDGMSDPIGTAMYQTMLRNMRKLPNEGSWHSMIFPPFTFTNQHNEEVYEMYVARRDGELYFFGNTVGWCLIHETPHKAVQEHVSADNQHSITDMTGIWLKEAGVREFAAASDPVNAESFLQWFDPYISSV